MFKERGVVNGQEEVRHQPVGLGQDLHQVLLISEVSSSHGVVAHPLKLVEARQNLSEVDRPVQKPSVEVLVRVVPVVGLMGMQSDQRVRRLVPSIQLVMVHTSVMSEVMRSSISHVRRPDYVQHKSHHERKLGVAAHR